MAFKKVPIIVPRERLQAILKNCRTEGVLAFGIEKSEMLEIVTELIARRDKAAHLGFINSRGRR